jgi:hypothetical protein
VRLPGGIPATALAGGIRMEECFWTKYLDSLGTDWFMLLNIFISNIIAISTQEKRRKIRSTKIENI